MFMVQLVPLVMRTWLAEYVVTKTISLFSSEALVGRGTVTSSRRFLRGFPRGETVRESFGEDIEETLGVLLT